MRWYNLIPNRWWNDFEFSLPFARRSGDGNHALLNMLREIGQILRHGHIKYSSQISITLLTRRVLTGIGGFNWGVFFIHNR